MMNRNDIQGFFPSDNERALRAIIEEHTIDTVIEIGAFLGRSTAFFAELCKSVVAIDPFVMWPEGRENGDARAWGGEDFYDKFIENMREVGALWKVRAIQSTSEEASTDEPDLKADLVFIDGPHDYESVKADIALWKGRAKRIICGDDYDENWPGVVQAVDEAFPDRIISGRIWYQII